MVALLFLGCAGLAVIGGRLFGSAVENAQPMLVTVQYSLQLKSHRFEAAQLLLSSDLQDKYSADYLASAWRKMEDSGTVVSENYKDADLGSETAKLTWLVTAGSKTYSTRLTLQKQGKEWKITGGNPGVVPVEQP